MLAKDIAESIFDRTPIEFIITTCPDYSYDQITGKFTFEALNCGVGLVAKETTSALFPLLEILERHSVYAKVTYAYANTEGLDLDILATMKISENKFLDAVEQSIVATFLYLRRILYENGFNFVTVDSVRMTDYFFDEETVEQSTEQFSQIDRSKVSSVAYERSKVIDSMFQKLPYSQRGDNFSMRRASKDIQDHMVVGNSVRKRRSKGERTHIVTMSIPHLANYFNYPNDAAKVPVITVKQNYA